jgi:hypothetical protein
MVNGNLGGTRVEKTNSAESDREGPVPLAGQVSATAPEKLLLSGPGVCHGCIVGD